LGLLDVRLWLSPHYFRHSIINQLHVERLARITFKHDVGWLNVAMDHTACFRGSQRARGLFNYFQGKGEWHRPVTTDTGFQRFALDQFHGIETLAILLSIISYPGNIRMMNVSSGARFP